jgi:hypothetical protein
VGAAAPPELPVAEPDEDPEELLVEPDEEPPLEAVPDELPLVAGPDELPLEPRWSRTSRSGC